MVRESKELEGNIKVFREKEKLGGTIYFGW